MMSELPSLEYAVMDSPDCAEVFRRWKRVVCKEFVALFSGEWAQSPMHSGRSAFEIRCSPDRRYFRVRFVGGVPSPVVLVARVYSDAGIPHFLGDLPRLMNKESPYAWPHVMAEWQFAPWVIKNWFNARSEAAGRRALDINEPRLLEMRDRRLERARDKKEREASIANEAASKRASEVVAALAGRRIVSDDIVDASLSALSDADLKKVVSLSPSSCADVAVMLIARADDIANSQHKYGGYLKPREASLRRLAERLLRLATI